MRLAALFAVVLIALICITGCSSGDNSDDLYSYAMDNSDVLRFGIYVTVHAVQNELNDDAGRREAVSVMKSLGITKIILETYRSGLVADEMLLKQVRDYFSDRGFAVVAGIATTPGKDFGVRQEAQLGWFNFQHPKTQEDLEGVVRMSARIFDELIIDDFLCTGDTSAISKQARGDRSWSEYRTDLLTRLADDLFVQPARQENPQIKIIIKYPQWYDRFHMFGYNPAEQPQMFDSVWIGTETRSANTRRMGYVPPYEGFINFRWISSFAPDKVGGAWFDHIECTANDFIEQAYQTVLAGAPEIILFNYYNIMNGHPGHHLMRRQFSTLFELAQMVAREPVRGIHAYKPPHSDAINDHYIMDFLGMIGMPLIPVHDFPENADIIFLPTQAAKDESLTTKTTAFVKSGGTVILTSGLLRMAADTGLFELSGIKLTSDPPTQIHRINGHELFTPVDLPLRLNTEDADALLSANDLPQANAVFTSKSFDSGSKVYVLNLATHGEKDFKDQGEVLLAPKPVTWQDLPAACLNTIRKSYTDALSIEFQAPGRVSLHPFGNNNFVIYNFNEHEVDAVLTVNGGRTVLKNAITNDPANKRIQLAKRSMSWLVSE